MYQKKSMTHSSYLQLTNGNERIEVASGYIHLFLFLPPPPTHLQLLSIVLYYPLLCHRLDIDRSW